MNITKRISKFGAHKVALDGITFDSAREARRYTELKLLERAGEISDLEMQKQYELVPRQGKERPVCYIADFVYVGRDGKTVVEDTKGYRTREYIIKRKLMRWIHGIEIVEV